MLQYDLYSFKQRCPKFLVVDRHRFDADPDLTFHFDANPDTDPTPNFTHIGKLEIFLDFIAVAVSVVLSFSIIGAIIFNVLVST